jgi:hypothetical protein
LLRKMAIPPEYVASLRAGIESAPEWKEAWVRANDYLDALRMPENLDRELLLVSSFRRAIKRKSRETFAPATRLALEEMQRGLDELFGHLVRPATGDEERSVEERLRLYLTEADAHGAFFRSRAIDGELLDSLRHVQLETGPPLQPASITPKPLEFTGWGLRLRKLAECFAPAGNSRVLAWILTLVALTLLALTSL